MKFYKNLDETSVYINGISTGHGQNCITETEYNDILAIIRNEPTDPIGYRYRLRNDTLEYELCEEPPEPEEPELSDN